MLTPCSICLRCRGADFELVLTQRMAVLDARYRLQTDGGDFIYVKNPAIRICPPLQMARLLRSDPVDAAHIYFRCSPTFETASPALGWIAEGMFIGTGARHPDKGVMQFFELS